MATQVMTGHQEAIQRQASNSWLQEIVQRFFRQPVAVLSLFLLLAFFAVAVFAPYVAPYDPAEQFRREGLTDIGLPLAPNQRFLLGTDNLGRDILSRTIFASRVSLAIGFAATLFTNLIALFVGGVAGFTGGRADGLIMRFVDLVMSVPTFFLVLLLIVLLGPSVWILVLVISLFGWTFGARIYRAEIRSLKNRAYVEAASALGGSRLHIFFRHILPHLLPLVATYFMLGIPGAIFAEAGLSFIGLGIQPPNASWGSMIFGGMQSFRQAPWVIAAPGFTLMMTVLFLNLVGNGLQNALNPTKQGR